jgi:hypothetical protein
VFDTGTWGQKSNPDYRPKGRKVGNANRQRAAAQTRETTLIAESLTLFAGFLMLIVEFLMLGVGLPGIIAEFSRIKSGAQLFAGGGWDGSSHSGS